MRRLFAWPLSLTVFGVWLPLFGLKVWVVEMSCVVVGTKTSWYISFKCIYDEGGISNLLAKNGRLTERRMGSCGRKVCFILPDGRAERTATVNWSVWGGMVRKGHHWRYGRRRHWYGLCVEVWSVGRWQRCVAWGWRRSRRADRLCGGDWRKVVLRECWPCHTRP
jgi:hypothetical protein